MSASSLPSGYPPRDHHRATTILVVGILSLVLCQVLGPVAWIMGNRALAEIDGSRGTVGGRGSVQAGRICGIIATALMVLSVLFVVLFLAVALTGASATPSPVPSP